MEEFYFIANSRNARALIEKLQPLIGATIGIANDLALCLKDVFDRLPSVVFIQNEIEGVPGEKLARKISAILDNKPMRFVLLYEDDDSIHNNENVFDASYNISHPDDELYRQILLLLHTMPDKSPDDDEKALQIEIGNAEVVTEPPPPPEELEKDPFDEFFDPDVVVFSEKPLPADDQVLPANMKAEEYLLESFLPVKEEEIVSFPDFSAPGLPGNGDDTTYFWDEGGITNNREVIEVTMEMSTLDADEVPYLDAEKADKRQTNVNGQVNKSNETADNIKPDSISGHQFKQSASDLSDITPQDSTSSILPRTSSSPEGEAGRSEKHFRHVERESPHQLFGSMTDEDNSSPFRVTATGISNIRHKGKPSLGALNHRASFSRGAGEHSAPDTDTLSGSREKQPPGTLKNERETGHTGLKEGLCDTALLTKTMTTPHKVLILSLIAVLTFVTSFLVRQWYFDGSISGLSVSQKSPAVKPMASPQAVLPEQELPKFIPRVAPDSLFALAHPGWERYEAESLEYNIYRESGRIKAIQVMAGKNGVITEPFVKSCIREISGAERYTQQGAEIRSDFKVIRGTLQNKGEVAIYQKMPEGAIRGFVLTMP
jgi:hypothetical protein